MARLPDPETMTVSLFLEPIRRIREGAVGRRVGDSAQFWNVLACYYLARPISGEFPAPSLPVAADGEDMAGVRSLRGTSHERRACGSNSRNSSVIFMEDKLEIGKDSDGGMTIFLSAVFPEIPALFSDRWWSPGK